MKSDCAQMMKDGIALQEMGKRLVDYARMMQDSDEKEEKKSEKGEPDRKKTALAIILKKGKKY